MADPVEVISARSVTSPGPTPGSRRGREFGLRLCGLVPARADVTDHAAAHAVFEVGASPELDHCALSGEAQRWVVVELRTRVFNTRA
ncbi:MULTISPECIES: hypothetical protein [Actinosynnema]|uniref:hypothetical protein n=1 Tax=Actinosynnema TaxID=40566 RepID=UPI0020A60D7C|nr:hypothetical protein [Actinosynnema pretiosum]